MAQYIDKSILVAEIEKRKIPFKRDIEDGNYPTYLCALMDFEDLLDTLEVKEVDSEKENLTPNDLSIIWNIIINLVTELQLRINKWPGEKLFEEALKRFKVQKKNDDVTN